MSTATPRIGMPAAQGMYDPAQEHDACGVGFIVNFKGEKSHALIQRGIEILCRLTHRGAVGADPLDGDGAGLSIQIPDDYYRAIVDLICQPSVITPLASCFCRRTAPPRCLRSRV